MLMSKIVSKVPLKNASLQIIGWVETDDQGNQKLTEFCGKILGWYDAKLNRTLQFNGIVIGYNCNILTTLIKS